MDEGGRLDSALLPAEGFWRQFVKEVVFLAMIAVSVVGIWVFCLVQSDGQVLLVALVYSAASVWAGRSWLTSMRTRRTVLSSGIPTLQLDDLGARVRHPYGNLDGAFLAWTDCAAVVVSRLPTAGRTPDTHRAYVELVPVSPDRVQGASREKDQRTTLLDRSATEVRTVWIEYAGVGRTAREVADWLRAHRPGLTVVDSLDRHSARTL
ncbi:hypothetical protein EUA93_16555 [Nocardioides oleivorans]|uniref:Uncharacterized protein n=1 Tax=Nocardioides oleivorans TaxID=273676 RepID=A0A4Q2RUU5_9ACTN|nr:hypothetical protein [Nocardioides oleivorans]RYB91754.1 hypothetical protein EUA93_16555 [Nocardioides oleivorans]